MLKRANDSITINDDDEARSSSQSSSEESDNGSDILVRNAGWKICLLGSRGIGANFRKLLKELSCLLPHTRKESKFEGSRLLDLREICELANCSHCAYIWDGKDSAGLICFGLKGPTIKYQVKSLFLSDDASFEGNCSKNCRPLLLFSPFFYQSPLGCIQRKLLSRIFGVSVNHRRARPFFDHLFYFFYSNDGHILFRNYEIQDNFSLLEIGPRFSLKPISIQEGLFSGEYMWRDVSRSQNPPNKLARKQSIKMKILGRDHRRAKALVDKQNILKEDSESCDSLFIHD